MLRVLLGQICLQSYNTIIQYLCIFLNIVLLYLYSFFQLHFFCLVLFKNMKSKNAFLAMRKKIIRSILAAELVLLIPLAAMQFSDEWDWHLSDFIIVGILLAGVGV